MLALAGRARFPYFCSMDDLHQTEADVSGSGCSLAVNAGHFGSKEGDFDSRRLISEDFLESSPKRRPRFPRRRPTRCPYALVSRRRRDYIERNRGELRLIVNHVSSCASLDHYPPSQATCFRHISTPLLNSCHSASEEVEFSWPRY